MGKTHAPRKGTLQTWPKKRAKKTYARVRTWAKVKEAVPLGFAGYKAGMTHAIIIDNRKTSSTKGMQLSVPVTIIECPPLRVAGIRAYGLEDKNLIVRTEVMAKQDKDIQRRLPTVKKHDEKKVTELKADDYVEFRLLIHTQPRLTGIGKKKPEVFELGLGGKAAEQLEYAKGVLGKDLHVNDLFKPGETVDIHAVTKGKGFQGPMKRFGIKRTSHKSEKGTRTPGSLGGWKGQSGWMYRVAKAGQLGYQIRTDYNKWVIDIGTDPKKINFVGGIIHYGVIKNPFVIVKGSVQGSSKRLIRFNKSIRPNKKKIPTEAPTIEYLSLSSKQGV